MSKTKLSAPWVNYYHELEAFFAEDNSVNVQYNNDIPEINIYVDGPAKANALSKLIPEEKVFGTTTLKINVIPSNKQESRAELIKAALEGNKAFVFAETIQGPMSNPMTFIVFKNKVVQYFTDDLSDYFGVRSTLYQDMAKELFSEDEGVYFSTNIAE